MAPVLKRIEFSLAVVVLRAAVAVASTWAQLRR
jgi:hypothetical protein